MHKTFTDISEISTASAHLSFVTEDNKMSQLQIPELRLPIPESPRIPPGGLHLHNMQNSGGVGSGPPLLLVPPSGGGVPRRRHSWICR